MGFIKLGRLFIYLFILNYKSCIGDIGGKIGTPEMRDHFLLGKSPGNTWVAWEIEEFFFFLTKWFGWHLYQIILTGIIKKDKLVNME